VVVEEMEDAAYNIGHLVVFGGLSGDTDCVGISPVRQFDESHK
jgi:hypothetical protein